MLNYGRIGGSVQRGNIINTAEELVNLSDKSTLVAQVNQFNTVTDTVIASIQSNLYNREKI